MQMDRQNSKYTQHSADNTLVTDDDDSASDMSDAWADRSRVWIPSSHARRTLVLCFDGTGDEFDSDNSNIVQLVSMLKKDDTTQQLVYYQTGIGTSANTSGSISSYVSIVLDNMFATNLPTHIKDGYAFLMQNYTAGDKVCIFGFSRGAYTARALAGMVQKVGLLPLHNYQQVPYAYDMFKREDADGVQLSELFKRTFCRNVHIDFLGVWDTVASVGAIPEYLPFVNENNGIRYLRHALSLDERRIKFLPTYCVDPKKEQRQQQQQQQRQQDDINKMKKNGKHHASVRTAERLLEDAVNSTERPTDVKEVWFAGVHCDVGGGSVKNETPHALARIPLRWMIRECFRCHIGIIFDAVQLQQIGLDVRLDSQGEPVLREITDRIAVTSSSNDDDSHKKSIGRFFQALAHVCWETVTYPFVSVYKILRSPFTSSPVGALHRRVIPARYSSDRSASLFRTDLPDNYEAEEERKDALSPLFDQLDSKWFWVFMEYMPMRIKKQKAIVQETEDVRGYKWTINRCRGREIYKSEMEEGMRVHRSVKTRLEAGKVFLNDHYVPQVRPHIPSLAKAKSLFQHKAVRLDYAEWNVNDPKHWEWVD